MKTQLLNYLQNQYAPFVNNIIESNVRFYRMNQPIRWRFFFDERVAIVALCDKITNMVAVNIASVDFAFRQKNEPLTIEYFLLHEIRHIYQHLEIESYTKNPSLCSDSTLAKKWLDEESNYVKALNEDGIENKAYFAQDMEMDAFAFSYAVMLYKYGEIPYITAPKEYQNETFNRIVKNWIDTFKKEGL